MAESLDATFFAFRKREKSGVLVGASIAFAIGIAIIIAAFVAVAWSSLGSVFEWYAQTLSAVGKGDPTMVSTPPPAGLFMLLPLYFVAIFAYFVLLAAYEAACLRWMVRGESGGGLMGLTFGADTWRVYATYWVWFFLFIGAYIGVFIVGIAIGAVGGIAGGESAAGPTIGFALLGVLAYLLAWLYVSVRLAPASATSVGVGRFSFFKAWSVTSGRFWAMFGAFLLLIVIYFVVALVVSGVMMSVLFAGVFANVDWTTIQNDPNQFMRSYFEALSQVFSNPAMMATYVVTQIVTWAIQITLYVMFYGVNARAVQAALAEGKIQVAPAT